MDGMSTARPPRPAKSTACHLDRRVRAAALRRDQAGALSRRPSTGRSPRTGARSMRLPPDPADAELRQHDRGAGDAAGGSSSGSPSCSSSWPGADTSDEICGDRARDLTAARRATTTPSTSIARSIARIAALYAQRDTLEPESAEQARVLERYHTRFVRAGAALDKPAQERLAAINERLASLGTQLRPERARRRAVLRAVLGRRRSRRPARFRPRGGPRSRRGARPARQICDHPVALSDRKPFLQFSSRRDLREKAFRAWIARGDNGGATDNTAR